MRVPTPRAWRPRWRSGLNGRPIVGRRDPPALRSRACSSQARLPPEDVGSRPPAPVGATPFKAGTRRGWAGRGKRRRPESEADFDEDDMEGSLLARRHRSRAQAQGFWRRSTRSPTPTSGCAVCRSRTSSSASRTARSRPPQERKYKKLKEEIVSEGEVAAGSIRRASISLVEQLYDINKRLVGYEGRLMRLSEKPRRHAARTSSRTTRASELDPRWLNRVSKLSAKGWKSLVAKGQGQDQGDARQHPRNWRARTGLEIGEFPPRSSRWCTKASAEARQAKKEMVEANLRLVILDCQEIHQSRPAVSRPDPGRQYRADEGGRQVSSTGAATSSRLTRPGGSARPSPVSNRRSGAHHPHPGCIWSTPSPRSCAPRASCSTRSAASRPPRSWP